MRLYLIESSRMTDKSKTSWINQYDSVINVMKQS